MTNFKPKRESEVRLACRECKKEINFCGECGFDFALKIAEEFDLGIICENGQHYCRACDPEKKVDKR